MIFFTPIIVRYNEKDPRYNKPHYNEQILSAPWPFIKSRLPCTRNGKG